MEATFQMFYTESRMRESRTLRLYHAMESQTGSMRGAAEKDEIRFDGGRRPSGLLCTPGMNQEMV